MRLKTWVKNRKRPTKGFPAGTSKKEEDKILKASKQIFDGFKELQDIAKKL